MARLFTIVSGFALVIAGAVMLVLPGPGILTILAGLALLGRELEWARRLRAWFSARFLPDASREPDRVG